MLGDVLFRIGETLGGLESQIRGAHDGRPRGREVGVEDGDGEVDTDPAATAQGAALAAAATWLVARLLRPKPVRWTRVIAAGVTGSLLAQVVGRLQDDAPAGELAYAEDPAELLGRVTAGVAVAAGYAALIYPRLPGSPLFRGLAFGALEVAAAPRGGLVALAAQAPGVRFPLQALALPVDEDASPLAHLAFGLALGLLYRNGVARDDEDDADDD